MKSAPVLHAENRTLLDIFRRIFIRNGLFANLTFHVPTFYTRITNPPGKNREGVAVEVGETSVAWEELHLR